MNRQLIRQPLPGIDARLPNQRDLFFCCEKTDRTADAYFSRHPEQRPITAADIEQIVALAKLDFLHNSFMHATRCFFVAAAAQRKIVKIARVPRRFPAILNVIVRARDS